MQQKVGLSFHHLPPRRQSLTWRCSGLASLAAERGRCRGRFAPAPLDAPAPLSVVPVSHNRFQVLLLSIWLLSEGHSHARAEPRLSYEPGMTTPAGSTAELAKRFQKYRIAVQDPSSPLRPSFRDWRGPMHAVMSTLAERLGPGHSSKEVVALMGAPDQILRAGSNPHGHDVAPNEVHLLYWWRGGHDYLYFIARKGIIVSTHWWHAGE